MGTSVDSQHEMSRKLRGKEKTECYSLALGNLLTLQYEIQRKDTN